MIELVCFTRRDDGPTPRPVRREVRRRLGAVGVVALLIGAPGCGGARGDAGSSGDGGQTGTGTSGGASTGTSSDATGTGSTSEATGDGGTETGDGDGPEECLSATDCELVQDCCTCDAIPTGAPFTPCPADCLLPLCDAARVTDVTCRAGACTIVRHPCNPNEVACQLPPPECPPGTLPGVDPAMACWSGTCVDLAYCDVTPDCAACAPGEICVEVQGWLPYFACEKKPPACGDGDVVDCECAGWFCDAIGFECATAVGGPDIDLTCFCPNC